MARAMRWVLRGGLALAAIAAIALGVAWVIASRSLPDYDGSARLEGLEADVEIVRDSFGVPRIFASTDSDGLFALGYVHATDRLWQMDVTRRMVQGRLAERFGARALPSDTLMRALDLDGHAERSLSILSAETKAQLEAYSRGVNARLAEIESPSNGAPEFHLFGDTMDPWTPTDSLSVVKAMAFQISMGSLLRESQRGRMLLALEPRQVRDLYPEYPGQGVMDLPAAPKPQDDARRAIPEDRALAYLGLDNPRMSGASSAWAVDGSRTAARAPLLASDPHLPLTAPAIWHPVQVTSPGLSVIGAALPGVPAIAYGRNADIAWGLTATQLDDIDIFIEKLFPDEPDKYVGPKGPLPFETRTETVKVSGAPDVTLTLRKTRHGPIIPLETAGLAAVTPDGHAAAISWTALSDDDTTIEALMTLNRASSAEEAIGIAPRVIAPALNLVVADRETVGIAVAGRVPLRRFTAPFQGRVPAPGWTDRNDWTGWMRPAALPKLIEPESGAVANANNRIGNAPFPRHLSFDWDAPYRYKRIEHLLNSRSVHSIESFKSMQSDTVSETARSLLALIGAPLWVRKPAPDAHRLQDLALLRLSRWNGNMDENAFEPLIFVAWMDALTAKLVDDELGDLAQRYRGPRPLFFERVFKDIEGASDWCDDISTERSEDCNEIALAALDTALARLEKRFGDDERTWRWGAAHVAKHRNTVLGNVKETVLGIEFGLGGLVNIEQETGGGDDTLNRGAMAHAGPTPFANVHGAGYRGIYDFSDPDRSVFIVSTGASGHPLSEHYANLSPLWRLGEYMPMSLDRSDIEPGAIGRRLLQPLE